jgi:DNA-directed RNA polymerase subunit M/transcription elongation factor TFIIS
MTTPDKLPLEDIAQKKKCLPNKGERQRILDQLADTMRENELLKAENDSLKGINRRSAAYTYDHKPPFKQPPISEAELEYNKAQRSKLTSCPKCGSEIIGDGLYDKNMDGNPLKFQECMKCDYPYKESE